ncbi:hypothetical protein CPC08DRAFT_714589 [Agrocybe pediades]|nr:hypothetical protein CPC08DRAFT_714589 [Agrocybe pediades]
MENETYRFRLNQLLQRLRKKQTVEYVWENRHAGRWTAKVLIHGMVYGQGVAGAKAIAYEYAAEQAFMQLLEEYPEYRNTI